MDILTHGPLHDRQQLGAWLQRCFPQHQVKNLPEGILVGYGLATGVLVRDMGGGRARILWEFPHTPLKLLLLLAIPLTGFLPGIALYGLVGWATRRDVQALTTAVAQKLIAPGTVPIPESPTHKRERRDLLLAMGVGVLLLVANVAHCYSRYDEAHTASAGYAAGYDNGAYVSSSRADRATRVWRTRTQKAVLLLVGWISLGVFVLNRHRHLDAAD